MTSIFDMNFLFTVLHDLSFTLNINNMTNLQFNAFSKSLHSKAANYESSLYILLHS